MKLAALAGLIAILIVGCGGKDSDPPGTQPDSAPQKCASGAKECRADGLYQCSAGGVFELLEACAGCEASPVPHCAVSCADPGVTSICEGDQLKDCATGMVRGCDAGACLPVGKQAVCATKPGVTDCQGRRADGSEYVLACADASGLSTTKACDRRTGECVAAQYDCSTLTSVPANQVACDAPSHNYYSTCTAGQPRALACTGDTTCANDGSTSCYTPPVAGSTCGGPAVCYPGLHCTQLGATGASCVQPAGILQCSSTDVLAVCTDADTGVACVKGAVWFWKNLTTWGGSCTSNHINLPVGGVCIPGLADCQQGLECHRSKFDIAGVCRAPQSNAPAECTLTGQASTGRSCIYDWHACADGRRYDVDCRLVNIAGNLITLCDCSVNGTKTESFSGDEICNVTTIGMLDTKARASCGWGVVTVDVSQN